MSSGIPKCFTTLLKKMRAASSARNSPGPSMKTAYLENMSTTTKIDLKDLLPRIFSRGPSPMNLLLRTFFYGPSPTYLLPRTFSRGPSSSDFLPRIFLHQSFSCEPSPTNLFHLTFFLTNFFSSTFSNRPLASPLSVTSTRRAINSGVTSYGRVLLQSHQFVVYSIPTTFPTTPNLPIGLSTCLTSFVR